MYEAKDEMFEFTTGTGRVFKLFIINKNFPVIEEVFLGRRKTPIGKKAITELYYEWLKTPTGDELPFDKFIMECED